MSHVKRLFAVLVVFSMIVGYILFDYSTRKGVPTKRSMADISKNSVKMTKGEDDTMLVDRQESGDGLGIRSSESRGVDIGDDLGGDETRKRVINRGSSEMDEEGDIIVQLAGYTSLGKENKKRRLPNAIIIGVKKGGTRALLEIMKIHPNVRAASHEAHFFDRNENYHLGLEWYRDQMPLSSLGQITMEKSPSYYVTDNVPFRIYQMSPSVKLIVVVRDPTQRAVSDYTQSLSKHPENLPFEEMVLEDRRSVDANWSKIIIGRYAQHLTKWLKFFASNQIHFVSGEQLIKNPAVEIKLVEKFLGLEPYITEDNFYFNQTKGFFCFVGKNGGRTKHNVHCMGSTKGRKHPEIRKDVLKIVQDYFRPHNKAFYTLTSRDFNWP